MSFLHIIKFIKLIEVLVYFTTLAKCYNLSNMLKDITDFKIHKNLLKYWFTLQYFVMDYPVLSKSIGRPYLKILVRLCSSLITSKNLGINVLYGNALIEVCKNAWISEPPLR